MRLLRYDSRGELCLTKDLADEEIPPYAILSHTWGKDEDEVTLQEVRDGPNKSKAGYKKLLLCGEQAKLDNLDHFWVDTCCIDKTSSSELSKNLNLMFRYYGNSTKCYVYLADVDSPHSEAEFKQSKWFTRGWTLQELLAPKSLDFFSSHWQHCGSRTALEEWIHRVSRIPLAALHGVDLSQISYDERMSWTEGRKTKEKEDKAYCLLGIFGVSMAPRYGEGETAALIRLQNKVKKNLRPTLRAMDDRIRDYYLSDGRLDIERLSGELLPMDSCFINLALLDVTHNNDGDRNVINRNFKSQDSDTFSLNARLKVEAATNTHVVSLEELFRTHEFADSVRKPASRIMIWGRAGMGKTTLCKKIVYDLLHNDLWQDLYDRVFWIPPRRLKWMVNEPKTVAQVLHQICFQGAKDESFPVDLLQNIINDHPDRCLFILDGLDEIAHAMDPDSPVGANLFKLLKQPNVIITSRPHAATLLQRTQPDLQCETVGFLPEQVDEFLRREMELSDSAVRRVSGIKTFIKNNPVVRSLIRIPIQLDAFCYVWNEEYLDQGDMTMTMLYRAIITKLWQKDIVRLGKKFDGEYITSQQIDGCVNVRQLAETEVSCLEELAFAGLFTQFVEFGSREIDVIAGGQVPFLHSRLIKLSFLRSSDNFISPADRSIHFIHLTFQEFFAAQYFVRHWTSNRTMIFAKMRHTSTRIFREKESTIPMDLVRKEKYSPRYEVFWRFVTGLLYREHGDVAVDQLFRAFDTDPIDQLGPVHQLLVIRCLNEVTYVQGQLRSKVDEIESNYREWVAFASKSFSCADCMLGVAECPNSILESWLNGSKKQSKQAMKALSHRPSVPFSLTSTIIRDAQSASSGDLRDHALAIIAKHCDDFDDDELSDFIASRDLSTWQALTVTRIGSVLQNNIIRLLSGDDPWKSLMAVDLLRAQLGLQEIKLPKCSINALLTMFKHYEDFNKLAADALELLILQDGLSELTLKIIVESIVDRKRPISSLVRRSPQRSPPQLNTATVIRLIESFGIEDKCEVIIGLNLQNGVPSSTIMAATQLLRHNDPKIRRRGSLALERQVTLTEPVVAVLVEMVQDSQLDVRPIVARILSTQRLLPRFAIEALIELWRDNHFAFSPIRPIIQTQKNLPWSVIQLLVPLLKNPSIWYRRLAAEAMSNKPKLPSSAVDALVAALVYDEHRFWQKAFSALSTLNGLPERVIEFSVQVLSNDKESLEMRNMAAQILNKWPILPTPYLHLIVSLLRNDDLSRPAAKVLEGRAEFYEILTMLEFKDIRNFMRYWLEQSLKYHEHICVLFRRDCLSIDIGSSHWTVKFKADEREDFERKWYQARKELCVPPTCNVSTSLSVLSK